MSKRKGDLQVDRLLRSKKVSCESAPLGTPVAPSLPSSKPPKASKKKDKEMITPPKVPASRVSIKSAAQPVSKAVPNGTPCTFASCLEVDDESESILETSPRSLPQILLRRALSIRELDDESWLSSSLIDLVIARFAKTYKHIHYMSIDFVVLALQSPSRNELEEATDITGSKVDYSNKTRSIVFVLNANNIHWNLIRVVRSPKPQLELFEPMGKPSNRHGGLSLRNVPHQVVHWLDICCPLESGQSWLNVGISAITSQQQYTAFDCGVACLLYAEKCGMGQTAEEINLHTTQENITGYRKILQDFTRRTTMYR